MRCTQRTISMVSSEAVETAGAFVVRFIASLKRGVNEIGLVIHY